MNNTSIIDDVKEERRKHEDESELSKIVDILLNEKYKRRKTILLNSQIPDITNMDVIGTIWDVPFLKMWVDSFAEWRTSGDKGKGRSDIVDITKFNYMEKQKERNELMELLRGRR